jgi:hypothetical protein
MDPWSSISLAVAFVILIFTSTIVGLIRHNVLLPETCCLPESPCAAILKSQHDIYYDPVTGLRTRYILATVFLVLTLTLRLMFLPISFPRFLNCFLEKMQHPIFLALLSLLAFTLQLLFADLTLHNLADSPIGLMPSCNTTSLMLVGAINVLAWFCLVLSCGLFFLFIVSQNTVHHYIPVLRFSKSANDVDDEETVVFGDLGAAAAATGKAVKASPLTRM